MIFFSPCFRGEDTIGVFVTCHAEKEIFLFVVGPHNLLQLVNSKLSKPIKKPTRNDTMKLELKNFIFSYDYRKTLFLYFHRIRYCLLVARLLQFSHVSSLRKEVTSIIYHLIFPKRLGRCIFQIYILYGNAGLPPKSKKITETLRKYSSKSWEE